MGAVIPPKVKTRKNNTGAYGTARPALDLNEGANITITLADDAAGNETDVTIAVSNAGAASFVKNEVPAGTVNGSNTAFTTASNFITGSLRVYKNGIRLKAGGADFTEGTPPAFTMVTAPATGTVLLVDYEINAGTFSTGSNSFTTNELVNETPNGSVTAFTVDFAYVAGSTQVFRDGQLMRPGGNDYTETTPASGIITFTTAPVTNSVILVSYQKSVSTAGNADTVDGFHANATATASQIPVLDADKKVGASGITAPSTDHIVLTPGTSKLVKTAVLRQDDTTNAYKNNTVILTGFGVITQDGTATSVETVTMGVTFAAVPVILLASLGMNFATATVPQTGSRGKNSIGQVDQLATSSFRAAVYSVDGTSATLNQYTHYSWIAIGELA